MCGYHLTGEKLVEDFDLLLASRLFCVFALPERAHSPLSSRTYKKGKFILIFFVKFVRFREICSLRGSCTSTSPKLFLEFLELTTRLLNKPFTHPNYYYTPPSKSVRKPIRSYSSCFHLAKKLFLCVSMKSPMNIYPFIHSQYPSQFFLNLFYKFVHFGEIPEGEGFTKTLQEIVSWDFLESLGFWQKCKV